MANKANGKQLTPSGRPAAWGTKVREKIDSTLVVRKLQAHVKGEEDMSATQIQAARILLNRTVPELKAIEIIQHSDSIRDVTHISAHDLLSVIEGTAQRVK
jgi:hypothetical protein